MCHTDDGFMTGIGGRRQCANPLSTEPFGSVQIAGLGGSEGDFRRRDIARILHTEHFILRAEFTVARVQSPVRVWGYADRATVCWFCILVPGLKVGKRAGQAWWFCILVPEWKVGKQWPGPGSWFCWRDAGWGAGWPAGRRVGPGCSVFWRGAGWLPFVTLAGPGCWVFWRGGGWPDGRRVDPESCVCWQVGKRADHCEAPVVTGLVADLGCPKVGSGCVASKNNQFRQRSTGQRTVIAVCSTPSRHLARAPRTTSPRPPPPASSAG